MVRGLGHNYNSSTSPETGLLEYHFSSHDVMGGAAIFKVDDVRKPNTSHTLCELRGD